MGSPTRLASSTTPRSASTSRGSRTRATWKDPNKVLMCVGRQWHEAHDLARRVHAARILLRLSPGDGDRPRRNRGKHGGRRRDSHRRGLRTDLRSEPTGTRTAMDPREERWTSDEQEHGRRERAGTGNEPTTRPRFPSDARGPGGWRLASQCSRTRSSIRRGASICRSAPAISFSSSVSRRCARCQSSSRLRAEDPGSAARRRRFDLAAGRISWSDKEMVDIVR